MEIQKFIGVRMVRGNDRVPVVINVKKIVLIVPVKEKERVEITLINISEGKNFTLVVAENYQTLLYRIFGEEYTNLLPPQ